MPNPWNLRGPQLWHDLHQWSAAVLLSSEQDVVGARHWLADFARRLPCGKCRKHWFALTKQYPPPMNSNLQLMTWTWQMHNRVNELLKKSRISWEVACATWNWRANAPLLKQKHASIPNRSSTNSDFKQGRLRVDCINASIGKANTHVRCALSLFGGLPHVAICRICNQRISRNIYVDERKNHL
jgi:Erv1 / Alr family